jgi:hypothetical protein
MSFLFTQIPVDKKPDVPLGTNGSSSISANTIAVSKRTPHQRLSQALINRRFLDKGNNKFNKRKEKSPVGPPESTAFALQSMFPNLRNRMSNLINIRIQSEFLTPAWFTSSTTVPVYGSLTVTLNAFDIDNAISAVFDQYRIVQIETWLIPRQSTADTSSASPGMIISAVDVDDANAPTSYGQVTHYQSAVESAGIQGHYHRWQPHVAVAAYSGVFTSFANEASPWIDMASDGVQHYGMKVASAVGTQACVYDLVTRAVFDCRGIH